jgi:hypothetical protein
MTAGTVTFTTNHFSTYVISTVDKIAPVVYGVANNGIYNANEIITFDKCTATLDGVSFTSGTTVKSEGKPQMSSDKILAISQLIDSMTKKFEHAYYHDEYALQIRALVDKKIEAQEVVKANEEVPQLPVMEAIRESILEAKPTGNKPTGNKPRKAKEKDVGKSKADLNPAPHSSQK